MYFNIATYDYEDLGTVIITGFDVTVISIDERTYLRVLYLHKGRVVKLNTIISKGSS